MGCFVFFFFFIEFQEFFLYILDINLSSDVYLTNTFSQSVVLFFICLTESSKEQKF